MRDPRGRRIEQPVCRPRSRASLEAEILILRHHLNIQRRHLPKSCLSAPWIAPVLCWAVSFSAKYTQYADASRRLSSVGAARAFERIGVVNRNDVVADRLCRWKFAALVGETSIANLFWGAPRIHGELFKLGIEIGQTSVAKYMAKRRVRRKSPRRSSAMPTASRRWICLWCRQSRSGFSIGC